MPLKEGDPGYKKSGHGPTYIPNPRTGKIDRVVYRCTCHGHEFETKQILQAHVRAYRTAIRKGFAELVRNGNLGQDGWDRLPGETPLQYRKFKTYLINTVAAGTGKRSLKRAADILGVEERHIAHLSRTWHWVQRAELWDIHNDTLDMAEFERQKRHSARKQATLGRKLQEVALSGASRLLANEDRLEEMSGNELAKLADVGTKIERLANSDATSIQEQRGQVNLVWEGPRPAWAPPDGCQPPIIEGSLTQKVLADRSKDA